MSDTPDGNEAQNRKIARQLFSIWAEEEQQKRSRLAGSLPAWIACVCSIGALVWNAAIISSDVGEALRRIEVLENSREQDRVDSQTTRDRLARIEAKIDVLMEGKK